MASFKLLLYAALCAIVSIALTHEVNEDPVEDNPLARLNEELVGPERNYDHQAWRVVESPSGPDSISLPEDEKWKTEEIHPEPPRRRRKRKRRPHHPPPSAVDGSVSEQDGVRFNIQSGISVAFDGSESERPRQRRPTRLQDDQHWRGDAVGEERPHRKRGHRRRQRPYLPDLGIEPTGNGEQTLPVKVDTVVHSENNEETHVRYVEEEYKVSSFAEEPDHGHVQIDNTRMEDVEIAPDVTGHEIKIIAPLTSKEESVHVDKSYRRPYSQAKKQEAEESAMIGGSTDLKALLKQSGGLSLSEVLQQRNLSLADLLTGKQYALSALKPSNEPNLEDGFEPISKDGIKNDEVNLNDEQNVDHINVDRRRRLPPVAKDSQTVKLSKEVQEKPVVDRGEVLRRRLPPTNVHRRQKLKPASTSTIEPKDTVTEKNIFVPNNPRKSFTENLIRQKDEEQILTTEDPSKTSNLIEDEPEINLTTQGAITTTPKKDIKDVRNRLSLKPRLRLPAVKTLPKRILNPPIQTTPKDELVTEEVKRKTAPIPSQAIPISFKDLFGVADVVSATKTVAKTKPTTVRPITTKATTTTTQRSYPTSQYRSLKRTTTEATTTTTTTTEKTPFGKVSAKDEILEVLTDERGSERLAKILAARNMTLKELVEHRERGSSQVHLADIFHNASREPDPAEPFLAKSLIEPISKEIYPLKALLEGNMRESTTSYSQVKSVTNPNPPAMFIDFTKASQNEDNLGIVTLFDKFADFIGNPKTIDPKDIKKDSDGSSYFTSVISVKPTDEVYRESRSEPAFHNSHKQMSEIYSSLPTFIKTDDAIDAKVVQDWNVQNQQKNTYNQNNPIYINGITENHSTSYTDKDVDGDGLVVLDDIEKVEQVDNHIAQASNQQIEENFIGHHNELNFYTRLPVGVRSAIIVSSAIVGTSLIVFLAIFVACRVRQNRRNLLKYQDSFNAAIARSPILHGSRKLSKNHSSSRSISPILVTGETMYRSQKINTMDSQTQRDAQEYLWDSLRKPFQ